MASAPRLAARCPACHTAFRVVADQLRLRGGLVRCGRCNHVFDGRAHLIELDTQPGEGGAPVAAPHPAEPNAPEPAAAPAAAAHPAGSPPTDEDDHGFGITLTWEADIAEVHLGEVEGAEPGPDIQPAAPDTRLPAKPTEPTEPAAQAEPPKAEPGMPAEPKPAAVQPEAPLEPPAPANPFHSLPPLLNLDADDDDFAAAVPVQPSAEPAVAPVPPAATPSSRPKPAARTIAEAETAAERHDSVWLRHQAEPHSQFAPV
ncbi:MJ0042-type zinc finger domain-containing protein, partial [Ralstonia solanacearum]